MCVCLTVGSSDQVESVMDEVEKYMMTRLYKEVFCPETTDDEKKDLAIQKRIRWERRSAAVNVNNAVCCLFPCRSKFFISGTVQMIRYDFTKFRDFQIILIRTMSLFGIHLPGS